MPHVSERRDEAPGPEDPRDAAAPGRDDPDRGGPVQPAGGQRVDPTTDAAGLPDVEVTDEDASRGA